MTSGITGTTLYTTVLSKAIGFGKMFTVLVESGLFFEILIFVVGLLLRLIFFVLLFLLSFILSFLILVGVFLISFELLVQILFGLIPLY